MEEYKKFTEDDKEQILESAAIWKAKVGKQTYRFPEDMKKLECRCQLCEKTCYAAERATYNQVPYHKNCFRCIYCTKKITPAEAVPIGEAVFVCTTHNKRVLDNAKRVEKSSDKSVSYSASVSKDENYSMETGIEWRARGKKQKYIYESEFKGSKKKDPKCQKCGLTVYPAEMFTYEKIPYHRKCVRCSDCKKVLSPSDAVPFGETQFLCTNHFDKVSNKIRDRANRYNQSSEKSMSESFQKTEDMSAGIDWKRSGKKQAYRYPEDLKSTLNPRCQFCGKTSYPAETISYDRIPYHHKCFRCLRCGKILSAGDANPFGEVDFLCNNHYNSIISSFTGDNATKSADTNSKSFKIEEDAKGFDPRMYKGYEWRVRHGKQTYKYPEDAKQLTPRCNYCGEKTYPAEMATYEKIPYHKSCFRCLRCNKPLVAANATPFGEDVFLCDSHFALHGQGGNLEASVNRKDEKEDAIERRKARLAKRRAKRNE